MTRDRWADHAATAVAARLERLGDPEDARAMAAYMRGQFTFLGVKSQPRDAAWREVRAESDERWGRPDADELVRFARLLWRRPERELRYVGAKALAARARALAPHHLEAIRDLIVTDAWWDTVDILAPSVVGELARGHPGEVVPVLDRWLVDDDHWLVRSAVLHQLKSRARTDAERLGRYCTTAAPHPEWFVRKAIGWALRQYSYVDGPWVESFVARTDLSALSRREALEALRRRG